MVCVITFFCDRCGEVIPEKIDRFLIKLNICYPYETLAIQEEDLGHDYSAEIQELVQTIEEMDIEELERDVGVSFQFEICRRCRDELINDPLGRKIRSGYRRSHRSVDMAGKVIRVDFRSDRE